MKRRSLICLLALTLLSAGLAHADLNAYLENLTISAHSDLGGFTARLGARFDLPRAEVRLVLSGVDRPADAAVVLWLGEQSHQSPERVLQVYREEKSHGWGAMAKRLGIKPGSAAFHALKNGDLGFRAADAAGAGHGKGKGHGKKAKRH